MKPNLKLVTDDFQPIDLTRRGLSVLYHGAETPCPGCHRHNWDVRGTTAECGFCGTALPLA